MKFKLFLIASVILLSSCTPKSSPWKLNSPDSTSCIEVRLSDQKLSYRVLSSNQEVIAFSDLGLQTENEDLSSELSFVSASAIATIKDSFTLVSGNKFKNTTEANEIRLTFKNNNDVPISILIRAYNNGIAFKYQLENPSKDSIKVVNELTTFNLSDSAKTWMQPYDPNKGYHIGCEHYYTNGTDLESIPYLQEGWVLSALFSQQARWLFISEAGLDGTSPGSKLVRNDSATTHVLKIAYPSQLEANGVGERYPFFASEKWESPWRVVLTSPTLGNIVESNVIYSLNRPTSFKNTEWIHTGIASWSWWAEPDSPKDYLALTKYIDFCAAWNIKSFLVDANWDQMKNGTVEELITYAGKKNVGIWLWYNSGGPHNDITEAPRDMMLDQAVRKAEMQRIKKLGVKGIKVDFFQSEKAQFINQYIGILNDAAENELMVNFHGCTFPRGWNRTYPNLMGTEAVRGAEYYMYDSLFPKNSIWHNTILPFTRNLTGPTDYTPFGLSNQKFKHVSTYANELALTIVFSSGATHIIDKPENYLKQPQFIKEFIANFPTSAWDDFHYIDGYPGKEIILARKSGNKWYIAGINGESSAKQFSIPLGFFDKDCNYKTQIISDGKSPVEFSYNETLLKHGDQMKVQLLPNGGFVAVLEK